MREYPVEIGEILLIAFCYICMNLLALKALGDRQDWSWDRQNRFGIVLLGGQLTVAAVILVMARFRFRRGLCGFGLTVRKFGKTFLLAVFYSVTIFGLMFFVLAVTLYLSSIFGYPDIQKHPFLELLEKSPPFAGTVILIISPALVAPLMEELLFRGLLQTFFIGLFIRHRLPTFGSESVDMMGLSVVPTIPGQCRWAGIFFTAVLFAVFHGNWQHWPALFVLGIGLGYAFERHGNLLLPIMVHSFFNIFSLTMTISHIGT
ncbi:MAG: CPBP family intramembrane metalloprotease [Sedimentisphaerales bacterium]|nr:CPBP family intramembrane metalloprotease [Sedimentisphaerales bacterium]